MLTQAPGSVPGAARIIAAVLDDELFLDIVAGALPEDGEEWQFQKVAGGSALVARLDLDESSVVVLIDVQSLDAVVTTDHVARVAGLAVQAGTSVLFEGPSAFICSRHTPPDDAVLAADLRGIRILSVFATGEGAWGQHRASASHQEFTQPPAAPALTEPQWLAVHQGSSRAVFHDAGQTPIASFVGIVATLAWHDPTQGKWGTHRVDLPAGATMTVPDQPPVPVSGVVLQFHRDTAPLQATGEAQAYAEIITNWLWN